VDATALAFAGSLEASPLPRTLNGRYRLTGLLGEGGMGVVYRATDLISGREVALKTLRGAQLNALSLAMFKAEFTTLAKLRHPNIAAVYDFERGHASAECFFTMELVFGDNALVATQDSGVEQILQLLLQALRALSYVHARGVIHLDLKPANILVTQGGEVRLLDFGIARSLYSPLSGPYATPIYVAPEVLSEAAEVDRRADLYSLGVTLFQLLFRRMPGSRSTPESPRLQADFSLAPEELARVPVWLPPILLRLVEKDPARRYRTANEVIVALNRARGADDAVETVETSDSYVASATLVGRGDALEALLSHVYRRLHFGRHGPLAALCVGPSGSGKSRLLREARQQVQLARVSVLEGCCYAEDNQPYAAWANIIAQAASSLGAEFGEHLAIVQSLAPELASRVGLSPQRQSLDAQALADGVIALLQAAAEPRVVTMEDLQWIDEGSLELLEVVLERCATLQREARFSVAFLLSAREQAPRAVLAALERLRSASALFDVSLPPLDAAQVGALVASMLGTTELAPSLSQALAEATRGNALLVAEVLRAWVKDGRLISQALGWKLRCTADVGEIAAQIADLLSRRVAELTPAQQHLLGALSVAVRPLSLEVLTAFLEVERETAVTLISELCRQKFLFVSRDERVHLMATHWSDAVRTTIAADARTALHVRLADVLAPVADAALVALHYERGAKLDAAATWYERAALHCFERGALKQVLDHAQKAAACGANGAALGRVCSMAAEAARRCGDARAASFAADALALSPPGSLEWLQASRVAIAVFNPLVTRS
jgi:tRNA A-37 threonylcarbamoyl transferase component Bud32